MLSLGKLHDSESTCTILDMPEYISLQQQVSTCLNFSDSIWHEFLQFMWFSNMSKHVQIQYDTNCYDSCDSQTCLNMLKYV